MRCKGSDYRTIMQTTVKKTLNVLLPLALGAAILWWMYKEFDFRQMADTLHHGMNWGWMAFSLVFGILAQVFRGLRWRQTLDPLGEHPRRSTCIHAVFISYAASLLIPRIGEVTRCGVLNRYEGTSFSKAIGTVITERIIDSLLLLTVIVIVAFSQLSVLNDFFQHTGTDFTDLLHRFTTMGYVVTFVCLLVTAVFLWFLLRRFRISTNLRKMLADIKAGILSLRNVKNKALFTFYTLAIWISYFLLFYITFYSFPFTQYLGLHVGIVTFSVCSIASVAPTPNGMGPFHFAVKTMLVLYGVAATSAETFVLIVHAVQTALIPLLAVYSLICLSLRKRA